MTPDHFLSYNHTQEFSAQPNAPVQRWASQRTVCCNRLFEFIFFPFVNCMIGTSTQRLTVLTFRRENGA